MSVSHSVAELSQACWFGDGCFSVSHRDESDACVGNDSLFAFWLVGPAALGKNYGQIRNFTTSESEGLI